MDIKDTQGEVISVKSISIRMPDGLVSALRKKAAEETVIRDRRVSMNELVVEILMRALESKKKGGCVGGAWRPSRRSSVMPGSR